ncbi:hypothetical protein GCM10023259_064540 [Thermocatellispora tengchongensis]
MIALTRSLVAENAALTAEVARPRERVAKLERLVSRSNENCGRRRRRGGAVECAGSSGQPCRLSMHL